MKNAVILARYSCEKQTELSIEGQLDVCYRFAKDNEYNIIAEYIDRAETGRTDDREQFQRMMKDAETKTFEYVIVYKFDRFARNKTESVINKNRLKKLGVKVVSATQLIPDAPEGVIFESIIEAYDEYFSLELAQKVLRTFKIKRKDGCFVGGKRTYGYDIIGKERKYAINSQEAEIVKIVYSKYLSGTKPSDICRELKQECMADLSYNQVTNILSNNKYIGTLIHQGEEYENVIPSIIDKDTFYAVQHMRGGKEKRKVYHRSTEILRLSNKCYCSACGNLLSTTFGYNHDHKRFYYYKCNNKECHLKPVNATKIENEIFDKVLYQLSKNALEIANKTIDILTAEEDSSAIDSLRERRKELERRKRNVYDALENIGYDPELQNRLQELNADIHIIDKKIQSTKKVKTSTDEIIDFINILLKNKDEALKDAILEEIIDRVDMSNEYIIVKCKTTQEKGGSENGDMVPHWEQKSNIIYTNYGFILRIQRCA